MKKQQQDVIDGQVLAAMIWSWGPKKEPIQ
jgi:hypothetical protein